MYMNTGYLNHSHMDFKDKSRPLVVGSCGTYRLSSHPKLPTYLNFQPGIALKASRAGNLHVIGTLNLCFSHTHIMFFRKFKSCL